jgi:hypothetical protein
MVNTLVVDAPEHAKIGGNRIQRLIPVGQPLLVRFKVVSANVRKGYRGPSKEERIGVKGILIEAPRSITTVLL